MSRVWTSPLITVPVSPLLGVTDLSAETGGKAALDRGIVAAAEVGRAVQKALKEAEATGLAGLQLNKATLSLETGRSRDPRFELDLWVFTISFGEKKQNTVTQILVFGAEKAIAKKARVEDLVDPLARAIAAAAATAAEINVLPLAKATIKIEFVVEQKVSGTIGFKLVPADVGAEAGIDFERTSKNGLEIEFAPR